MSHARSPAGPAPRLAVILPLDDARGDVLQHLSSWTSGQTYPRERYQVVLGTDGSRPDVEARVRSVLMPQDRLVHCAPGSNDRTLSDAAARAASGEILLFTELHCIASPSCVAETLRTFDDQGEIAAAYLTCDHRPHAWLGDMEKRMLEQHEAITLAPGHWFKFHTDAFAIRRREYVRAGGLDGRYGLFADAVLAARAHELGMTTAHAASAVVTHLTSPSFAVHQGHVSDWTWGECAYRAVDDPARSERYFGHAPEWANRHGLSAAVDRAAIAALARVLARDLWSGANSGALTRSARWLTEMAPRLLPALLGPRARLAGAWTATRWNEAATRWLSWTPSIRWHRYQRSAACLIRLTRLSWALAHPAPPGAVAPTPPRWPVDVIPPAQQVGFHGREQASGEAFRWSEPVAFLRLALPPGSVRLAIETRGLRGDACEYLHGMFWDGRAVTRIERGDGRVTGVLDVRSPAPAWLVLVSDPLRPRRHGVPDERRLGVPVFAIEWTTA